LHEIANISKHMNAADNFCGKNFNRDLMVKFKIYIGYSLIRILPLK